MLSRVNEGLDNTLWLIYSSYWCTEVATMQEIVFRFLFLPSNYSLRIPGKQLTVFCGEGGGHPFILQISAFHVTHMNSSPCIAAEAASCKTMHISLLSKRHLSKLAVTSLSTRAPRWGIYPSLVTAGPGASRLPGTDRPWTTHTHTDVSILPQGTG